MTPVTAPLLDSGVASVGGMVYTFSGVSTGAIVATSYKYNPATNAWTTIAPLPAAREQPSAVSDGTYIYILGGADTTGATTTTMYRYDPVANTWTPLAPSPDQHYLGPAVYSPVTNKVYNFGGFGASGVTNVTRIYDIATNSWSTGAPMLQTLSDEAAVYYNGRVYVAGGWNGRGPALDLYAYDIANRLTRVRRASDGLTVARYFYDSLDRRIRKTVTNSFTFTAAGP